MTEQSALWMLTNILCIFFGWMTISHTIIRTLSCLSTNWKETWLDIAAFSIGIMFAAMGLGGLLRLSEENKNDELRFSKGCGERPNYKESSECEGEETELLFRGSHWRETE